MRARFAILDRAGVGGPAMYASLVCVAVSLSRDERTI